MELEWSFRVATRRTYTDRERTTALELLAKVGATAASRKTGISRETIRWWAREAGVEPPPPAKTKHGTRSRYKAGCRCDECRAAQTAGERARRSRPPRERRFCVRCGAEVRLEVIGKARYRRCLRCRTPSTRNPPRFSLAPVRAAVAAPNNFALADFLGVSARQLYRWDKTGISLDRADAFATLLGRHPRELWGEWWVRFAERP